MLFDILKEITQHTSGLGFIDIVKIIGDDKETKLAAMEGGRKVVVRATFNEVIPEFEGTFGMPNLGKLQTILNVPMYKEDAVVVVKRQMRGDEEVPASISFENKDGDFTNEYRLQGKEIIDSQLPTPPFKGIKADVTITPSVANIQRFKYQAQANNEEVKFIVKTVGNDLKFYFGDASSHAGNFTFQNGITGSLKSQLAFPIAEVLAVLNLPGDKVLQFADSGALLILVDSGMANYSYIFPSITA